MIKIPENLKKIINKIEDNGYEAYIVGGAVRDIILKKDPRDWDVVSSASYEILKKIFFEFIFKAQPFWTGLFYVQFLEHHK